MDTQNFALGIACSSFHPAMRESPQDKDCQALRAKVADLEAKLEAMRSDSRLGEALDCMFEGVQIVGRDWRYLYVNATAALQGRRRVDELLGKTMMEMYPGIEATSLFPLLRTCMEERIPRKMSNHFSYPDGQSGWFDLRIEPVPAGILILSVDISEAKAAEQDLHRTRANLETTLQCMAEGVLATDASGRVTRMNAAAERLLGRPVIEATGQRIASVLHLGGLQKDLDVDAVCQRALNGLEGMTFGPQTVLFSMDGRQIPVGGGIALLRNQAGGTDGLVIVIRDMTEERNLASQLLHSQKMEAIGRLAGGVAHDFNNLLTVIIGYSELLKRRLPESGPFQEEIGLILEAGERAGQLTRQLLAFSRKQVLRPERVNLCEAVSRSGQLLRRLLSQKVSLKVSVPQNPCMVLMDPGQLEAILMNLAVNANDAMPDGGQLTVGLKVDYLDEEYAKCHEGASSGPHALLTVSDSGIGMDGETRSRIFEPFYTTKAPGKGTGLGLSTVYGAVQQSGGHIWVYSEPGMGTTFKIFLPLVQPSAFPTPAPSFPSMAQSVTGTILLVEDEPAVLELASRILEGAGFAVLKAASAEEAEALAGLPGRSIDMLLTDVVLPGMNGVVLARRLGSHMPGLRIVLMSGYGHDIFEQQGLSELEFELVEKPLHPTRLLDTIRTLMSKQALGQR